MEITMKGALKAIFLAFVVSLPFTVQAKKLSPAEAENLYLKGKNLQKRGYFDEGDILVKQAAEAGNTSAMCLWGEVNGARYLTGSRDEMAYWYQKAKEKGAACGYIHTLGGNSVGEYVNGDHDSGDEFIKKFTPLAENGDADAMMALSIFYGLRRDDGKNEAMMRLAAEAGVPRAMDELGEGIINGYYGFYLFDENRQKEGLAWVQRSAMRGNDDAFSFLERYYIEHGDAEQLFHWMEKGMKMGTRSSISSLSEIYAGQLAYDDDKKYNLKLEPHIDKAKSYACLYILINSFNNESNLYGVYKARYEKYKKAGIYSPDDMKKGEVIGKAWLKTHQIYTDPSVWVD